MENRQRSIYSPAKFTFMMQSVAQRLLWEAGCHRSERRPNWRGDRRDGSRDIRTVKEEQDKTRHAESGLSYRLADVNGTRPATFWKNYLASSPVFCASAPAQPPHLFSRSLFTFKDLSGLVLPQRSRPLNTWRVFQQKSVFRLEVSEYLWFK